MSTTDPRHYDVIIAPVITEKATLGSEHSKVMFKLPGTATKPQSRRRRERLFDVKVRASTPIRSARAGQGREGHCGRAVAGQARRIVTLEEGHSIDRDHGLKERAMHSNPTTRSRPSQRQLVLVRSFRAYRGAARSVAAPKASTRPAVATTTAASPVAFPRRPDTRSVSQDRLQAPKARHAGQGRAHRVRPQSHRLYCIESSTRRPSSPISGAASGFPRAHAVVAGEHAGDVKPGNANAAGNIPIGTIVHNVEIKIGKGGQIARSAGTYAQIVGRDGGLRHLCGSIRPEQRSCMAAAWRRSARCQPGQHETCRSAGRPYVAGWGACRTSAA